jgi:hypothetical protein
VRQLAFGGTLLERAVRRLGQQTFVMPAPRCKRPRIGVGLAPLQAAANPCHGDLAHDCATAIMHLT